MGIGAKNAGPDSIFLPGARFVFYPQSPNTLRVPADAEPLAIGEASMTHPSRILFGYTIPYVRQQWGHSSAKVTLDTYGRILEEGPR